MVEVGLLLLGLLLGSVLGWAVARGQAATGPRPACRTPGRLASRRTDRTSSAKQLSQRDLETGDLRGAARDRARGAGPGRDPLGGRPAGAGGAEARCSTTRATQLTRHLQGALGRCPARRASRAFSSWPRASSAASRRRSRPRCVRCRRRSRATRSTCAQLEATRQDAYGSLEEQLRSLATTNADLQRETRAASHRAAAPNVRGRWGEITLHRVVELAGLTEHCDYGEQVTVEGQAGRLRPDMVGAPAGRREIVVDAKVPLAAYLEALGGAAPEERAAGFMRHAAQMRQHMNALAGKSYWDAVRHGRPIWSSCSSRARRSSAAAAEAATASCSRTAWCSASSWRRRPRSIALLRADRLRLEAGAAWPPTRREISELGRELYERLRTLAGHVDRIGGRSGASVRGLQRRGRLAGVSACCPQRREFRELGAGGATTFAGSRAPSTSRARWPRSI